MLNKLNSKRFFSTLLLSAMSTQMFSFGVNAQYRGVSEKFTDSAVVEAAGLPELSPASKIAPDLKEKTNELDFGSRGDELQKVIIQLKSDAPLNKMSGSDLSETDRNRLLTDEVRDNRARTGILISGLTALRGRIKKSFNNLGLVSAELPLSKVRELSESENVAYISPDREIESFGHVGETTGWYNPGISDNGDADPNTWLDGGFGHIAVIDSGIDSNHSLMRWADPNQTAKVQFNKDFTGQNITGDAY